MKSRALNDLRLARLKLRKPVRENLPAVLLEAMAGCLQIVEERDRFPELGSGRGQERFQFTSSHRERDLRRLEAIALVGQCLLSHTDLVTLRSGKTRRDNSCDSIRVALPRPRGGRAFVDRGAWSSMETETGLTRTRLFDALRDGRDAGYWTSHQPRRSYEGDDGQELWRGFPAVYQLSKLFFQRLGIDLAWLEEQRQKASRRQREEPAPIVDIRLRRERQRVIRSQAMAAKRATAHRPTEAEARAALRALEERVTRRPQK